MSRKQTVAGERKLARFRQIETNNPATHHDAIEFADGEIVLLTRLCAGQRATVLQLPVGSDAQPAARTLERDGSRAQA